MSGTTPSGAHTEQEASAWVRGMFGRIAPRYDLVNHVLSFNIDRRWRRLAVRKVRHILERPDACVLDICCGTGDLLLALQQGGRAATYGSDFCHPMLLAAKEKSTRTPLFESDAMQLPLRDGSLDLVTVAFGFRNLTNYEAGLREMCRVLRPGGVAAILEFSQPPNRAFAAVNALYCRTILPMIGGFLTGSRDAYTYLPESIHKFPNAPRLAEMMRAAGFESAGFEYLTGGSVALHIATRYQ